MKKRMFLLIAALLLTGCGSSDNLVVDSGGSASLTPDTTFPSGKQVQGVAADYVVMAQSSAEGGMKLVPVLHSEFAEKHGLRPVAGATITYPDGTIQTTDANGFFDSSQSSYAAENADIIEEEQGDMPDAPVLIQAPAGSELAPLDEIVNVPKAAEEAQLVSGAYFADDLPNIRFDQPEGPAPQGDVRGQTGLERGVWTTNIHDYLVAKGYMVPEFWPSERIYAIQEVTRPGTHKVGFTTTFQADYVPFYAIAGTARYVDYEWGATWTKRRGDRFWETTWTMTTLVENQPANLIAMSAYPAWYARLISGSVGLTLFRHP